MINETEEMIDWLEMHYRFVDGEPMGIAYEIAQRLKLLENRVKTADAFIRVLRNKAPTDEDLKSFNDYRNSNG